MRADLDALELAAADTAMASLLAEEPPKGAQKLTASKGKARMIKAKSKNREKVRPYCILVLWTKMDAVFQL